MYYLHRWAVFQHALELLQNGPLSAREYRLASLQLEQVQAVLVSREHLAHHQYGGEEQGGVGPSVEAVDRDNVLPVGSQELQSPHRDVQELFQRRRDVRRPTDVDDAAVRKPRRRVLLLAEVEDGVVAGVPRLQDLPDVLDGVLVGGEVHAVGGAGHAGDARGQQVQVEVLGGEKGVDDRLRRLSEKYRSRKAM